MIEESPTTFIYFLEFFFLAKFHFPFLKNTYKVYFFARNQAVCVLGFGHLREGLQRKNLARYDSYSAEFFDLEDQYFREFPYRISVNTVFLYKKVAQAAKLLQIIGLHRESD